MKKSSVSILFLLIIFANHVAIGQVMDQQAAIRVEGDLLRPQTLHDSDLVKMNRVEVTGKDRDGKEHHFTGVALTDILRQAGATLGAQLRGDNMIKYLIVRSGDGYEVLFSLAELDSGFTDRMVILADRMDGQPLPAGVGPFRIIAPGEKKHARWIWEVNTLIVRSAKE